MVATKQQNKVAVNSMGMTWGYFKGCFEETRKGETLNVAVFECPGMVKGSVQHTTVLLSDYYGTDTRTGKFLAKLGFQYKSQTETDEYGLIQVVDDNLDEVDDFIESCIDKAYTFKMERKPNGFDTIDIDTIKVKKEAVVAA